MIRTENLGKTYNGFAAVNQVTLHVQPNEIYGFLGPNGAGKTTTILMLLGLEKPTAGQVFLFGQPLQVRYFETRRRLGVVAEHQYFYDDMTAVEYLRFFAELYRVPNPEVRITELLEMVDLHQFANLRANDFSRGMQQKLGLIRALLHDPELLILDEPVSALDPHGVVEIRRLLLEQAQQGKTIFISSHILSEVEQTADRIGIMNHGALVAEGTLANLRQTLRPQVELTVELAEPVAGLATALRSLSFVADVVDEANRLQLNVAGTPETLPEYRRQISQAISGQGGIIIAMQTHEMSLEEAFVTITEQNVSSLAKETIVAV